MKTSRVLLLAAMVVSSGVAYAGDEDALVTGRSVAVEGVACDRVTPVCASMGGNRFVPYDNECQARADGAASVSFSGCFDEN